MTKSNAITVLLIVASAVLPYLLSQNDVTIPPVLKVLLTATNIAVVTLARLSNPNSEPVQVQVQGPVETTGSKS